MTHFHDPLFDVFLKNAGPHCRLRYAPTPSGYLHLGNALNFRLNWLVARQNGGKILLRIDDLDADRKRPEYVADVFESLRWLGLDWDEGPGLAYRCTPEWHSGTQAQVTCGTPRRCATLDNPEYHSQVTDFEKNWSQHRRMPLYVKLLDELRATGLLYACHKSRRDLAPFGSSYPVEFREQNLSLDEPDVAWRIATPTGFPLPDFIVRRRDGLPAYQVASLADDLHFGITHIVRGADLEPSTAAQRWLAECLGKQDFLNVQFYHHPLLTNAQGEKLSKSAGSTSLRAMRESGEKPPHP